MASLKSISVTIPATTVRRQFGDLVRRVHSGKEHFVVEKDGLPVAAIISMADYAAFLKEREFREERLRRFEENARAFGEEAERRGITEESLMVKMKDTRKELFKELYGDDQ
jgi:prevent-host-death family protein